MCNRDFFSSLFWTGCGLLMIFWSLRLPVGGPNNPGPGFLPLSVGILMTILSAVLLGRSVRQKEMKGALPKWEPRNIFKLTAAFAAMLIYIPFFPLLGFLFATIPLMIFLFKAIGETSWKLSIAGGTLLSLAMYMIFKVWLQVQFPIGPWGI